VSTLRAYFELLRLPAVFTAVADVMMGYLVTRGELHPVAPFAVLATISALLYLAGMVLNDVFDADADARERPARPIPSGRVSRRRASILGWSLLVLGVLLAIHFSDHTHLWRITIVAVVLASCIVLYNAALKKTVVGPIAMGACRMLNVLLGMSLAAEVSAPDVARPWSTTEWAIAVGIGTYVAGVTRIAQFEAHSIAVRNAVRILLRALIVIDAAVVLGFCGVYWACAVLLLLVPMLLLERWASVT
jgi:4-hydroxybenzoate polyprenyltransferase